MYQAPLVHACQASWEQASRPTLHIWPVAGTAGTGAYNNEDVVGASLYSHSWERVLWLLSNRCTPISGGEGIAMF